MKAALFLALGLSNFSHALEVHEWGTFTVFSGSNGIHVPRKQSLSPSRSGFGLKRRLGKNLFRDLELGRFGTGAMEVVRELQKGRMSGKYFDLKRLKDDKEGMSQ